MAPRVYLDAEMPEEIAELKKHPLFDTPNSEDRDSTKVIGWMQNTDKAECCDEPDSDGIVGLNCGRKV